MVAHDECRAIWLISRRGLRTKQVMVVSCDENKSCHKRMQTYGNTVFIQPDETKVLFGGDVQEKLNEFSRSRLRKNFSKECATEAPINRPLLTWT